MKICVFASSNSLDAFVDPRSARCPYFVIVNLEDMNFEVIQNPASETMGGSGIQAAQLIARLLERAKADWQIVEKLCSIIVFHNILINRVGASTL